MEHTNWMADNTWMAPKSGWSEFILVGIFNQSQYPALLYVVVFIVFLMALSVNSILILLIRSETRIHTPMYFFISQLSLMDVMYISVTVPKMLVDRVTGVNKISAPEFEMQIFLYLTLEVHHFFCEVPSLLKLSCSDTSLYETLMYLCCILMLLIPVTINSGSYGFILLTIHRMNSAEGRKKAFASCSSHMTVVTLFYGAAVYTYMLHSSYRTPEKDMVVSVFNTILTPVLNPLIYILRNKDVTGARKKMLRVGPVFQETIKLDIFVLMLSFYSL
ncbi:Olfactory Receptor 2T4 [Manis pentadactyla]|nr:Olfactory Receptor 2T4 [Manis pentadactyla]